MYKWQENFWKPHLEFIFLWNFVTWKQGSEAIWGKAIYSDMHTFLFYEAMRTIQPMAEQNYIRFIIDYMSIKESQVV